MATNVCIYAIRRNPHFYNSFDIIISLLRFYNVELRQCAEAINHHSKVNDLFSSPKTFGIFTKVSLIVIG
jgi:hypothetical protein